MTIVNPMTSANLVVQATLSTGRPEERHTDLRIEQIVRATVVEGGLDRATLEMNQQRFQIATERELLTGQQLELQVLTTRPQLTFKILTAPLETRLTTLFPLLAKSFDWDGLVRQLQQPSQMPARQAEALRQSLAQLAPLLRPAAPLATEELTSLVVALGQLRRSEPLLASSAEPGIAAALDKVLAELGANVEELDLPQQLRLMAARIRAEPVMMKQFAASEGTRIAALLKSIEQREEPLAAPQARRLATELKGLLQERPTPLPQALERVTRDLGMLLEPRPPVAQKIAPALFGSLQQLTLQLRQARQEEPGWPTELRQVVERVMQQMQPLVAEPEILAQGEKLGLLTQLFGLNLEAELLRGRTREALQGLKFALLGEREKLGSQGEEALHRLELFQVCRARLFEQNQLFFPLPFPFLEEGFLLVERDGRGGEESAPEREEVRMSLHLRLSELGNLQIDLLAEQGGLLVRVACEDQARADFLKAQTDALRERLKTLPLRGVTFTLGARAPSRELLQRLLPQARGMLDTRI